jgi:hypothetical protein
MQFSKIREIQYSSKEWHNLLSILAYIGGLVEYKENASQHESLKALAVQLHTELARLDEDDSL